MCCRYYIALTIVIRSDDKYYYESLFAIVTSARPLRHESLRIGEVSHLADRLPFALTGVCGHARGGLESLPVIVARTIPESASARSGCSCGRRGTRSRPSTCSRRIASPACCIDYISARCSSSSSANCSCSHTPWTLRRSPAGSIF